MKEKMKERGGESGKNFNLDAQVVLCCELESRFVVEREAMMRT